MRRPNLNSKQLRYLFANVFNTAKSYGRAAGRTFARNPEATIAAGGTLLAGGKLVHGVLKRRSKRKKTQKRFANTVIEAERRRLRRNLTKKEVKSIRKSVAHDFDKYLAPDIRRRAKLNDSRTTGTKRKNRNVQAFNKKTRKTIKRKVRNKLVV